MNPERLESNQGVSKLESAFGIIERDQKLQFFADGKVRVLNLVETGETEVQSMSIGESDEIELHARVSLREPVVSHEYTTLDDLVGRRGRKRKTKEKSDGAGYYRLTPITNPEYLAWKSQIPTVEQIREAAVVVSQEPKDEDVPETLGIKATEVDCLCTHGGIIFEDFVEEETVQLRETGQPDPDCEECGGTGKIPIEIPIPNPDAPPKIPEIILRNYVTGEERVLYVDVAALVASGDMDVSIEPFERVHRQRLKTKGGTRLEEDAHVSIKFGLRDYVADQARQIGIDINNSTAVRFPEESSGIVSVETVLHDTLHVGASWNNRDGEVTEHGLYEVKDPIAVVREAQEDVPSCFFDRELTFKPASPLDETFSRLLNTLGSHGYTLGFKRASIATGMDGPAFYALDQDGYKLTELGCGYEVPEALDQAWENAQKWLSQIP